jgi:hypothetical protein
MKLFLFVLFFCSNALFAASYSIAFVHIGDSLPPYIKTSISQARLFNPEADIYLVVSQKALKNFPSALFSHNLVIVPCETLTRTQEHKDFLQNSSHDSKYRAGFWKATSERFLYLHDLVSCYGLTDLFHLENDVMLYADLGEMLPHFQSCYKGIGATFDNDDRCIPGFVYIANSSALASLATHFAMLAHHGLNDMQLLAHFKREGGQIDNLPIIMNEYVQVTTLQSSKGHTTLNPTAYCKNADRFQSIFDAAAYGQYLGGQDPRNGASKPGFINESSLVNPTELQYIWLKDAKHRKVPYAQFKTTKWRINCLHIHSKNLEVFSSTEK